ncbi:hypothetical protein BDP55DRAFT_738944 [Colletotrichum godetiae]|uniref:Uncharacterized protein n=1 Tax=Colletotrichum godetiae TaxID=1209918 RepID=A0AAJ0AQ22_9PEZI|nr:uncharacterized protein BDP55DRAFT_738944 [Colletotrichum godetiae]KAK1688274.1 hypothetical protein BDP55DRAFT_738944 [Colletotrichum godetiae]
MFRACRRNVETVRLAPAQDIPRLRLVKPSASFSPRRSDSTNSLRPQRVANGLVRFPGSHSGLPYLEGSTHSWSLLPPVGGKHTDKIMPLPSTSCSNTTSLDADSKLCIPVKSQRRQLGSLSPSLEWQLMASTAQTCPLYSFEHMLQSARAILHDHYSDSAFELEPEKRVATAAHSVQPPARPRHALKLPRLLTRISPGGFEKFNFKPIEPHSHARN